MPPPAADRVAKLWGSVGLITGLLSWSTLGGMLLLLECVGPLNRAAWRAQMAAAPFLILFFFQLLLGKGNPRLSTLGWKFYALLGCDAVALAGVGTLWIWSMSNTTLAQSYLLSNTHGLIIVVLDLVMRKPVSLLEMGGTAVGFTGAGLTLLDDTSGEGDVSASLKGSMAAFLSAVCIVIYFKILKVLTANVPSLLIMMPVTMGNAFIASVVAVLLEGATVDTDACIGLFGWATEEWWWMAIYLSLAAGLSGMLGYTIALQALPMLLVSAAMLLEPILGVAFGLIIKVNPVPGVWTWVGGGILLLGMAAVTFGSGVVAPAPPTSINGDLDDDSGIAEPLLPSASINE